MSINTEVQEELEGIAVRCNCELLHADFRGGVLKLILDREGGVTLKECSDVSREASAFLDVVDFGSGHYTLEVTSPGLDREFYSESDYQRFLGEPVRVSWLDQDQKRTDSGRLIDYEPNADGGPQIALELPEGVHKIKLDQVLKTRLEPKF
ncbi:MAG: ribosome maturation factor [bacterium]|nr:ribosome maturation factor [bacterium]